MPSLAPSSSLPRLTVLNGSASNYAVPSPLQVLEFSVDEEDRLVARMLRQSMYGVESARRVYPHPEPTPVPEPPRPSSPSPMDAGAHSFA